MRTKKSVGEIAFDTCNVLFLTLFSVSILLPFWVQFCLSTSAVTADSAGGFKIWPTFFTWNAYRVVFRNSLIYRAYLNTIFRTLVGTALHVIVTGALAYSLSKKWLWKRNFWTVVILIPMFFSGGLIPTFILITNLGLYDSIWVYILPTLFSSWNAILMRNYMMTIPSSIEESARIDGANEIIILFKLIFPLCKPILATVALWTAVGHWNSWFDSMIYTTDPLLSTIAYQLFKILRMEMAAFGGLGPDAMEFMSIQRRILTPDSIKAATLIITILPIVFSYPFLQKYFVKGIIIGSLKG